MSRVEKLRSGSLDHSVEALSKKPQEVPIGTPVQPRLPALGQHELVLDAVRCAGGSQMPDFRGLRLPVVVQAIDRTEGRVRDGSFSCVFSCAHGGKRKDLLGSLEQIILLAVLRLGSNAYGVTIRREIEQRTGRNISIGAVYATLERLQAKGYVSSFIGEPTAERGGRAKRFFRIEAGGKRALQASQEAARKMSAGLKGRLETTLRHPLRSRWLEGLLGCLFPDQVRESVLGDLAEEYSIRSKSTRSSSVARWYWRQLLVSIPAS